MSTHADSPLASPEWAGFVEAIRFAPAEDTHRLVAADWLEDNSGRPELVALGQFIRYHIERTHARPTCGHPFSDSCGCSACGAERRAVMLYDRYGARWSAHLFPARPAVSAPVACYDRGIPGAVGVNHNGLTTHHAQDLAAPFVRCPILGVSFTVTEQHDSARGNRRSDWAGLISCVPITDGLRVRGVLTTLREIVGRMPVVASRIAATEGDVFRAVEDVASELSDNRFDYYDPSRTTARTQTPTADFTPLFGANT